MQPRMMRATIPVTAAVIGLFGLAPPCRARDQDYWLKFERRGVGFGWEHVRAAGLPGGHREYQLERHLKVNLIGLSAQEIVQQGTFRVDQNLRPLAFNFRTRSKVGQTEVSGQCLDRRMRLRAIEFNGGEREYELECRDVFFSVTVPDLIARRSGKRSFRTNLFDPATPRLRPTEVHITRVDATGVEAQVGDLGRYHLDRAGQVREINAPTLGIRAFLTDPTDARNITYLDTADGLTLTVHAKGPLPNPFRTRKVRIAVAWSGVPPGEFRLEDKRQRILRTSTSQGAHEAVLEITRIDLPGRPILTPVRAREFSDYLAEDEYIKPGDPAIRGQLAEIRGEEKHALAIVERILKWIRANITTDLILETLPAPVVLQRRSGKCSEYAILFAALARAAGIPTKMVLGQATNGQYWVGHMWNEVWLGEWLPVDPSMGSFVVGPSHLKLVDAPTVKGMQSLRMKLVDNLALEILGFEEDQAASSVELKTGIVGNTYTSAAYRCRLSRPDATWSMAETSSGSTVAVTLRPPELPAAKFELTMFAVPPGYPAKTILDGRIKALSGILGPLEILESSQMQIAGSAATCVVYRVQNREEGTAPVSIVSQNCLFVDGANGYLFKLVSPQGKKQEVRPAFDAILTSFERVP